LLNGKSLYRTTRSAGGFRETKKQETQSEFLAESLYLDPKFPPAAGTDHTVIAFFLRKSDNGFAKGAVSVDVGLSVLPTVLYKLDL
jgi:hypothetical protein